MLRHSGQAVARHIRIGDQKLDQFGLTSTDCDLPKSIRLLPSIPLFEALDLYEAEISQVSIQNGQNLV